MKQLVLTLLVVTLYASAPAQILYVDQTATGANDGSSWADAYTTLTAAVDVANTNASVKEIRLANNTIYTSSSTYTIQRSYDISGSWNKATNTQQTNTPATTLDGEMMRRIMHIRAAVTTRLSGLVFTRGGNHSGTGGALETLGQVSITHCIFRENKVLPRTNPDGSISRGLDIGSGAAIFNSGALVLSNSQFYQNTAGSHGGAILNRGEFMVTNCLFEGNGADDGGGAIACFTNYQTSLPNSAILDKCRFTANYIIPRTSSFGRAGGAVELGMVNAAVVVNCIFDKNKAYDGGAIGNQRAAFIRNCTFFANELYNELGGTGGAIYSSPFDNQPKISIQNCAFWGNIASATDRESIYIDGGSASIWNCLVPAGTVRGNSRTDYGDNINDYPFWVDPVNGDFRLLSHSPAINKGNNRFSLATDEPGDFYGALRISPCTIDIGAAEFQLVNANGLKPDNNGILYVDKASTYNTFGDKGSHWSKALPSLTVALLYANTCESVREIHVAKGNYQESTLTPQRGYIIKGSYDPATNTRDWKAHPTIIDLYPGNSSGRLMTTESTVDNRPITLDGLVFQDATQTALINYLNTELIIANCIFYRNTSDNPGGAVSNLGTIRLFNCVFTRNHSNASAGALANFGTCTVVNATFNDNSGPSQGSQVINNNLNATMKIQNSIIANLPVAYSISNSGNLELNRNIIQGYFNGTPQYVNSQSIDRSEASPLFINAANNDLRLNTGSPAINKGSNALYEAADGNTGNNSISADIDFELNTRVYDGAIDLGAIERQMKQQTISVADTTVTYGDPAIEPDTTATTSLTVTYASADNNVAEAFTDTDNKAKIRIKNKGTVAVTANQAGDATYDPAPTVSFTVTVNPKPVTVTAEAKSKVYGDADPALTFTAAPALVAGDAFTGSISRDAGETAGVYSIQQNNLALSDNYLLSYSGANFTIDKKAIAVAAEAKSKTYGEADPALTYTFSPALAFSDVFNGTLSRAAGENTGTYAIQNGLTLSSNYTLTYTGANLVINPRAIAVAAEAKSKTYGDADPALTYTFSPALAFNDAFTGSLSRTAGENAGTYAIQNGLTLNNNYTLSYTGADLVINPKAITVTAANKSKTYGAPDPALTYTFSPALAFSDAFSGTLSRIAGENAGTYSIHNGLTLNNNYTLSYTGADLVINPKAITVTAANKSKTYGAPDPALTYTISPALVGSDVLAGNITRAAGENAGTYAITQGSLANGNYAISFVPGQLVIDKASQQITWNQSLTSACNGSTAITLTATSSSGLPVGYQSANTGVATVTNDQLTLLKPGIANITASQPGNQNYLPATNVQNSLTSKLPAWLLVKHWNDVLMFDNSSKEFTGWQWYKNGSLINGATGQYYYESGNLNGEYYAVVKTASGETLPSCPVTLTPGVTVAPVSVFPNPTGPGQAVTVKTNYTTTQLQGATIMVSNNTGAVVATHQNVTPQTTFSMPLIQGLYVVRLKLSSGITHAVNVLVKP